jgi:hypothetical protein
MVDATWRRARSSPVTLTNLRSSRFRQQPTNITGRWVEWEIKRGEMKLSIDAIRVTSSSYFINHQPDILWLYLLQTIPEMHI